MHTGCPVTHAPIQNITDGIMCSVSHILHTYPIHTHITLILHTYPIHTHITLILHTYPIHTHITLILHTYPIHTHITLILHTYPIHTHTHTHAHTHSAASLLAVGQFAVLSDAHGLLLDVVLGEEARLAGDHLHESRA